MSANQKKDLEAQDSAKSDELAKEIRQAVADGQLTKMEAEAKLKAFRDASRQKKAAEAKKEKGGERE